MSNYQPTPAGALATIRIIWGALIMGVLVFFGVVLFIMKPTGVTPDPQFTKLLLYIAIGMLCVLAPLGFVIRGIVWRAGRKSDGSVAPGAYNTGIIIQLAMCEGTAFFALVGAILNGGGGPHLIVAVGALVGMFLGFPTGGPLRGDDAGIKPMHRYDSNV